MENKFIHPEGKIQLLNSIILDCYDTEEPQQPVHNSLELDTTGEYLTIPDPRERDHHRKDRRPKNDIEKRLSEEELLFLANAFKLFEKRDVIYADSRMFLSPVPVQSGLAYTGTSGFRHPTIGIYLEWWEHCKESHVVTEDGTPHLVWHLAGSPLSGCNRCSYVNEAGIPEMYRAPHFAPLWQSFMRINTRYDEAKSRYQAMPLKEVLDALP